MTLEQQIRAVADVILEYTEAPEHDQIFHKYVMSMRKEHGAQNKEAILRELTGALYDGLAYGNWPWKSFKVDDLVKE